MVKSAHSYSVSGDGSDSTDEPPQAPTAHSLSAEICDVVLIEPCLCLGLREDPHDLLNV